MPKTKKSEVTILSSISKVKFMQDLRSTLCKEDIDNGIGGKCKKFSDPRKDVTSFPDVQSESRWISFIKEEAVLQKTILF